MRRPTTRIICLALFLILCTASEAASAGTVPPDPASNCEASVSSQPAKDEDTAEATPEFSLGVRDRESLRDKPARRALTPFEAALEVQEAMNGGSPQTGPGHQKSSSGFGEWWGSVSKATRAWVIVAIVLFVGIAVSAS